MQILLALFRLWKNQKPFTYSDTYYALQKIPEGLSHVIFAGAEFLHQGFNNELFSEALLSYIHSLENYEKSAIFPDSFINFLATLKRRANISCYLEGSLVFAKAPFLRVEAEAWEQCLIESIVYNKILPAMHLCSYVSECAIVASPQQIIDMMVVHDALSEIESARYACMGGSHTTASLTGAWAHGLDLCVAARYGDSPEAFPIVYDYQSEMLPLDRDIAVRGSIETLLEVSEMLAKDQQLIAIGDYNIADIKRAKILGLNNIVWGLTRRLDRGMLSLEKRSYERTQSLQVVRHLKRGLYTHDEVCKGKSGLLLALEAAGKLEKAKEVQKRVFRELRKISVPSAQYEVQNQEFSFV